MSEPFHVRHHKNCLQADIENTVEGTRESLQTQTFLGDDTPDALSLMDHHTLASQIQNTFWKPCIISTPPSPHIGLTNSEYLLKPCITPTHPPHWPHQYRMPSENPASPPPTHRIGLTNTEHILKSLHYHHHHHPPHIVFTNTEHLLKTLMQ